MKHWQEFHGVVNMVCYREAFPCQFVVVRYPQMFRFHLKVPATWRAPLIWSPPHCCLSYRLSLTHVLWSAGQSEGGLEKHQYAKPRFT